jgi:hypothetical protein
VEVDGVLVEVDGDVDVDVDVDVDEPPAIEVGAAYR